MVGPIVIGGVLVFAVTVVFIIDYYGDFDPLRGIHPFTEAGRQRTQAFVQERRRHQRQMAREREQRSRDWRARCIRRERKQVEKLEAEMEGFDGDILEKTDDFGASCRIARLEQHVEALEKAIGHVGPKSAWKRG